MKNPKKKEKRITERVPVELRTIVQVKESDEESWKEITSVSTVSRNGAGFTLTRACTVGRLVTLVLPMPDDLRAYDRSAELYPVLGLVQYCNKTEVDGVAAYHVGVGFVGKHIPESFKANPQQTYRITGVQEDGLWSITEADNPFKPRKNPRMWVSVEITVSLIKKDRQPSDRETTVTQNISVSGMSIECSIPANVDDRVKIGCKAHDFYAIAVVRNRKVSKDKPPTLHLEFVDHEFPMEKLYAERAAARVEAKVAALAAESEPEGPDQSVDVAQPPPPPSTTTTGAGQFEFSRF